MEKSTATFPTPYPDLNIVLRQLVEGVQEILGDNFLGLYLQGSFAVGDFDIHSDVDFIVATEEELCEKQVLALQRFHERTFNLDIPWAQHLEGSYFPKEILRDASRCDEKLWYLDHGAQSLIRSTHCNTAVVRWTAREFGVPLAGPRPASLVDPMPVSLLRREILGVINAWGQQILAKPEQYNNRFYQGFIVLNFSRMLHDLYNGRPGSKRAGAEWAKANLDPSWSGLIDRAWDGRPNPAVSVRQTADPADFERTLAFVQYIIKESARYGGAFGDPDDCSFFRKQSSGN